MTELSGAVSEEDRVMVITKMIFNLMQKMAATLHRPLIIIAYNANDIWR
jgi:hypothetical protein